MEEDSSPSQDFLELFQNANLLVDNPNNNNSSNHKKHSTIEEKFFEKYVEPCKGLFENFEEKSWYKELFENPISKKDYETMGEELMARINEIMDNEIMDAICRKDEQEKAAKDAFPNYRPPIPRDSKKVREIYTLLVGELYKLAKVISESLCHWNSNQKFLKCNGCVTTLNEMNLKVSMLTRAIHNVFNRYMFTEEIKNLHFRCKTGDWDNKPNNKELLYLQEWTNLSGCFLNTFASSQSKDKLLHKVIGALLIFNRNEAEKKGFGSGKLYFDVDMGQYYSYQFIETQREEEEEVCTWFLEQHTSMQKVVIEYFPYESAQDEHVALSAKWMNFSLTLGTLFHNGFSEEFNPPNKTGKVHAHIRSFRNGVVVILGKRNGEYVKLKFHTHEEWKDIHEEYGFKEGDSVYMYHDSEVNESWFRDGPENLVEMVKKNPDKIVFEMMMHRGRNCCPKMTKLMKYLGQDVMTKNLLLWVYAAGIFAGIENMFEYCEWLAEKGQVVPVFTHIFLSGTSAVGKSTIIRVLNECLFRENECRPFDPQKDPNFAQGELIQNMGQLMGTNIYGSEQKRKVLAPNILYNTEIAKEWTQEDAQYLLNNGEGGKITKKGKDGLILRPGEWTFKFIGATNITFDKLLSSKVSPKQKLAFHRRSTCVECPAPDVEDRKNQIDASLMNDILKNEQNFVIGVWAIFIAMQEKYGKKIKIFQPQDMEDAMGFEDNDGLLSRMRPTWNLGMGSVRKDNMKEVINDLVENEYLVFGREYTMNKDILYENLDRLYRKRHRNGEIWTEEELTQFMDEFIQYLGTMNDTQGEKIDYIGICGKNERERTTKCFVVDSKEKNEEGEMISYEDELRNLKNKPGERIRILSSGKNRRYHYKGVGFGGLKREYRNVKRLGRVEGLDYETKEVGAAKKDGKERSKYQISEYLPEEEAKEYSKEKTIEEKGKEEKNKDELMEEEMEWEIDSDISTSSTRLLDVEAPMPTSPTSPTASDGNATGNTSEPPKMLYTFEEMEVYDEEKFKKVEENIKKLNEEAKRRYPHFEEKYRKYDDLRRTEKDEWEYWHLWAKFSRSFGVEKFRKSNEKKKCFFNIFNNNKCR